ncbi:MAG: prolipoprotein diacylglyceryl transferase [Myxococcales bacterium]|nr:prolipoprotein diacylglyceryl transferase [Myxococcales bacterium]
MLPYVHTPSLPLPLGLKLEAFGVLSAAGTLLGAYLSVRAARKIGPGDDEPLRRVATWAIVGGLLGAHLLHVLGYHPELLAKEGPVVLLRVWDGLSSMGGVLGALAGIILFFRRNRIELRPYLNALAVGATPGWAVARIGCFFAHDHPGVLTSFPLAVAYPGGARHDLGLYDALVLAVLCVALYSLARKRRPPGFLMGVLAIGYSVPRFFLDFLRASDLDFVDKRYAGFTPAQIIVVVLIGVGVWLIAGKPRAGPAVVDTP